MTRLVAASIAVLALATSASAHTLGLSESELTVEESGAVHGRIAIPSLELSALAPVDRDGDGRITQAEVDAERSHFERLAVGLLELHADGVECTSSLQQLVVGPQQDGVDLFVAYSCPPQPQRIEVQALLLSTLPLSHRHALLLRAGSQSTRAALAGPMRRAELVTGFARPGNNRALAWGVLGVLGLAILALALRRGRQRS